MPQPAVENVELGFRAGLDIGQRALEIPQATLVSQITEVVPPRIRDLLAKLRPQPNGLLARSD